MGFDYSYDYYAPEPDLAYVGAALAVVGVIYLLILAFGILSYVLQSVGLYSLSKRRGIRHAWLSWLPLGNLWILGSISDQYQYVAKGRVRNRRKALLGLSIANYIVAIPFYGLYGVLIAGMVTGFMESGGIWGSVAAMILFALAIIVLSIILTVFYYIALYDLFSSCNPDNAAMFLVLSIFFGVALPFFLFFCRKKDGGMPPRRPAQPVYEPPVHQAPAEIPAYQDTTVEEFPAQTEEDQ